MNQFLIEIIGGPQDGLVDTIEVSFASDIFYISDGHIITLHQLIGRRQETGALIYKFVGQSRVQSPQDTTMQPPWQSEVIVSSGHRIGWN